jgi:hypothetical protein
VGHTGGDQAGYTARAETAVIEVNTNIGSLGE